MCLLAKAKKMQSVRTQVFFPIQKDLISFPAGAAYLSVMRL